MSDDVKEKVCDWLYERTDIFEVSDKIWEQAVKSPLGNQAYKAARVALAKQKDSSAVNALALIVYGIIVCGSRKARKKEHTKPSAQDRYKAVRISVSSAYADIIGERLGETFEDFNSANEKYNSWTIISDSEDFTNSELVVNGKKVPLPGLPSAEELHTSCEAKGIDVIKPDSFRKLYQRAVKACKKDKQQYICVLEALLSPTLFGTTIQQDCATDTTDTT